VKQDPRYTATSLVRKPIGVPVCAVKVSRSFRTSNQEQEAPSSKRRKNGFSASKSPMVEMGFASEGETASDIDFLYFSDHESATKDGSQSKGKEVAMYFSLPHLVMRLLLMTC
jgi:hypothetical protein